MAKLVIGLIGGIGSGKSVVAAAFASHGGKVISGDALGHEALRQPAIRKEILRHFGAEIADQTTCEIDRRKLAAKVFSDHDKLRTLEKIVFPFIEHGLREQIVAAQDDHAVKLIVVDAAVMLEAGWNKTCDKIVYVHAPRETRMGRLGAQRGWTEQELQKRSQAQFPLVEKAARADAAIDNSGSPAALAGQVARLMRTWGFPVALEG